MYNFPIGVMLESFKKSIPESLKLAADMGAKGIQVYATYGDDRGADNTAMTTANASMFAPSALTGAYSRINVNGTTDCLEGYPVYSLTEAA